MRLQRRALLIAVMAAVSAITIVSIGVALDYPRPVVVSAMASIGLIGSLAHHYLVRCPRCHRRAGLRAGPGVRCRYCSHEY